MLCVVTIYYAVWCCVMLCHVMLCYVTSCYVILRDTTLCNGILVSHINYYLLLHINDYLCPIQIRFISRYLAAVGLYTTSPCTRT